MASNRAPDTRSGTDLTDVGTGAGAGPEFRERPPGSSFEKGPLPALTEDRSNRQQGQGQADHSSESFPCRFQEVPFLSAGRHRSDGPARVQSPLPALPQPTPR